MDFPCERHSATRSHSVPTEPRLFGSGRSQPSHAPQVTALFRAHWRHARCVAGARAPPAQEVLEGGREAYLMMSGGRITPQPVNESVVSTRKFEPVGWRSA